LVRKFLKHQGYAPNLSSPNTFNEKVLHKMLFDRRRILQTFADKLAVREYVEQRLGGKQHLSVIHAVFSSAEDLYSFTFPSRFALKANHGSGWNYIHHGGPLNRVQLVQRAHRWMHRNYGLIRGEWCYKDIQPRVFCEEYLGADESAPDYKFFCFSGRTRFILAVFDRYSSRTSNIYGLDWNLLDVQYRDHARKLDAPAPTNLAQMISIAERLSDGVDFVRVDLYDVENRVVFGELTNYPGGLEAGLYPQQWDATFGSYWRLPVHQTAG
jgi:hypothetical protein